MSHVTLVSVLRSKVEVTRPQTGNFANVMIGRLYGLQILQKYCSTKVSICVSDLPMCDIWAPHLRTKDYRKFSLLIRVRYYFAV